jgi:hypothetical protein
MDQYREAVNILMHPSGEEQLIIHDTDRYYLATVDSVTTPITNASSTRLVYTVNFTAQPWAIATTAVSDTFTGTGDVTLTDPDLLASRKSYPIIVIASGVTALVATDDSGHTLDFTRGAFSGAITVDPGALTVTTAGGVNAINSLNSLNFGLYHPGSTSTFELHVATYTGSGTSSVSIYPRYVL